MRPFHFLFGFSGKMPRLPYALGVAGLCLSQYGLVHLVFTWLRQPLQQNWRYFFMPFSAVGQLDISHGGPVLAGFLAITAFGLLCAWALAALSVKRAADAGSSGWYIPLVLAPFLQLPVLFLLCIVPPPESENHPSGSPQMPVSWKSVILGFLTGVGVTLLAVLLGGLIFGTYGYGMFAISPIVIGATTAFIANWNNDIGFGATAKVIAGALSIAGIALVLVALEGIVCIIMAAPLAFGAALIGGAIGRAMALSRARSRGDTLKSIALLPLVFASEQALPQATAFHTTETIEIAAPPAAVWRAILDMGEIGGRPALPFRLGVAYPLRGKIIGQGVGAIREGTFSTGVALERVIAWEPNRLLAFTVIRDVPAMRELSPYRNVNPPHARGYFLTPQTSFEIQPLGGGRSRVVERTEHILRLDPVPYWMPLARLVIHENNRRVLTHIQRRAVEL